MEKNSPSSLKIKRPRSKTKGTPSLSNFVWRELKSSNPPPARQFHSAVLYKESQYVFGGFSKSQCLDDFLEFNFVTKTWRTIASKGTKPSPRYGHIAVTHKSSMYLYGGVSNGVAMNDIFEYNFGKKRWTKTSCIGEVPPPLWGHSGVLYKGFIYVFGGMTETSFKNELWRFDIVKKSWAKLKLEGDDIPSARQLHSAIVYDSKMYLFGGFNGVKDLSTLHAYDFATGKFEGLRPQHKGRRGHVAVICFDRMALHGGRHREGIQGNILVYNFKTGDWEDPISFVGDVSPSPRYLHTAVLWCNSIAIFGGLGPDRNREDTKARDLNDLFLFSSKDPLKFISGPPKSILDGHYQIDTIPFEILEYIFSSLQPIDLCRLSCVNKFLYCVSGSDTLWKFLYKAKCLSKIYLGLEAFKLQLVEYDSWKMSLSSEPRFFWKSKYEQNLVLSGQSIWKSDLIHNEDHLHEMHDFIDSDFTRTKTNPEVKIVVAGDGGVGKSALVIRFIQNVFVTEYDPTIEDSYRKLQDVNFGKKSIKVLFDVLDTAGTEDYSAMRDQYYRAANGFVIVYSIVNRCSFESVSNFRANIIRAKDEENVPIVIVGNKTDLESERAVSQHEGYTFAKENNHSFFEMSVLQGGFVEEIFTTIALEVFHRDLFSRSDSKLKKTPKKNRCEVM